MADTRGSAQRPARGRRVRPAVARRIRSCLAHSGMQNGGEDDSEEKEAGEQQGAWRVGPGPGLQTTTIEIFYKPVRLHEYMLTCRSHPWGGDYARRCDMHVHVHIYMQW